MWDQAATHAWISRAEMGRDGLVTRGVTLAKHKVVGSIRITRSR
jgi:hypothetical protein